MEKDLSNMQTRINEMYKYAISTGKVSSKSEFADLAGVSREMLSRYFAGVREPSKKTLAAINRALENPFSDVWLLTGTGAMMADGTSLNPNNKPSDIQLLITEMRESRIAKDEQIGRLLTIIENMQNK